MTPLSIIRENVGTALSTPGSHQPDPSELILLSHEDPMLLNDILLANHLIPKRRVDRLEGKSKDPQLHHFPHSDKGSHFLSIKMVSHPTVPCEHPVRWVW